MTTMREWMNLVEGKRSDRAASMLNFLSDPKLHLEPAKVEKQIANTVGNYANHRLDQMTVGLKIVRGNMLNAFVNRVESQLKSPYAGKLWNFTIPTDEKRLKDMQAALAKYTKKYAHNLSHELLAHIGQPYAEAIDWMGTPADDLLVSLKNAARRYHGDVRKRGLVPKRKDKKILDLGNGWAWWHLPRKMCSDEGDLMRHCGNDDVPLSGETILSLRKEVEGGRLKPYITAVIRDGMIGEVRGFANTKPKASFHPAMVALLNHDMVRGVSDTGKEEVFQLDDLSDELRSQLSNLEIRHY